METSMYRGLAMAMADPWQLWQLVMKHTKESFNWKNAWQIHR